MNFLPDVECETCQENGLTENTEIRFKGKSISVLNMTVDEAVPFFEMIRKFTASKNYSRCRFRIHYLVSRSTPHAFGWQKPNIN
jgi:excinuclease UvrABC ATPase subunit